MYICVFCYQYARIVGEHAFNKSLIERNSSNGVSFKIKGLREVVWVFWATSERWEHACEHFEPQIFLVA
jgi:hypothetical protein